MVVRAFFEAGWEAEMSASKSEGADLFLLQLLVVLLPLAMEFEVFIVNEGRGMGPV